MTIRSENLIGHIIAGYRVLEVLGRGGMSIVFLAERLDDPQNKVAIKVLMPSDFITPEEFISFQARFVREAQAAHQMHHPHILPVLGYGEENDLFYMIMPVVTGGTLATRLAAANAPLPLNEIANYLNQLAGAIDYANQHGIIHRDIKPSNVLIDTQDNLYLVDFGIVHLFDSGPYALDQAPTALTTTGKMYGTPTYMSPERFKGEQAGPATDIYALGVMLYQLVTGRLPYIADNPLAIGMKHLNEQPVPPRVLRPDLPKPAEAAILKALAKQPADRFPSASSLAEAFEAGLQGRWVPGLFPLPPVVPPELEETRRQQPVVAPVVPVPEGPFQSNQLVLGPAVPYNMAPGEAPIAFVPTQANPAPFAAPARASRSRLPFLLAALLIALLLLGVVAVLGYQRFATTPGTGPGGAPAPTAAPTQAPTPTPGITPTPTPTPGVTPTPTPRVTPTPTPTPGTTPTPTPGVTPTPTPGTTPTSTPAPKATSTSGP